MRKVLHYTDSVGFGGAEKMLLTLMQGLQGRQWRPVLLFHAESGEQPFAEEARERGIEAVPLPPRAAESGMKRAVRLAWVIREYRADIFHAHLPWALRCTHGLAAAFLARVPRRVATQQLFAPIENRRKLQRQGAVARLVDRYIAVSHTMAAQLRACAIPARKVIVVHNGIEVERFDRPGDPHFRASLAGGSNRPLVLTLARLDWQKGLGYLVEAAAEVPEAVFVVAGEGMERERLAAEVERLGLGERFRLLGHRSDIAELLAACDVVVLPSLFEGLPVSILEAMAARKPVVATAVNGNDEAVVDGVTGLLVPAADPERLAAALRRLLADPALARRLGSAGYNRVEDRFSARAMVAGVERLYAELLDGRGARRPSLARS
jgi:glycosyltransferase involved in cell wall biosynthesis